MEAAIATRASRTRRSHAPAAVSPAVKAKSKPLKKGGVQQIAFRYREKDTAMGVTRDTARRLAEALGVDETTMLHMALRKLANVTLPQYPMDNGPLTDEQFTKLQGLSPKVSKKSVRSSLF